MAGYGCGVIAATDILFYLDLHKEYCKGKDFQEEDIKSGIVDIETYQKGVQKQCEKNIFRLFLH